MSEPARSRASWIALWVVLLASVPASVVHGQEQPPASATPGRIVTDVRDVTITVSDLARSLTFYRTLGFESTGSSTLPPRAPLGPEFSMLPGAPTTARVRAVVLTIPGNGFALRLVEFSGVGRKAAPSRMQDVGAVRFGVVVRRIDATFADLTKMGAPVVTQAGSPVLFPQGGGGTVRAVALRDPDGVLIELLQIDPAPATGAAASGRVLNARFVVCARDAFRSLGFYQTVFGLEQEKIAFWDPEKKPIRVEWNASPGSLNVFDTPAAQFRFVLGHFPGLPDLWEFTEYKDIERRQLRPDVFDPGAIVLSLTVRDLDAVLRAFQASGGALVSSRGQDGRGSQGVVFVRDLDGLLLELIPPRGN